MPASLPASGRAAAAISYAMAQVGDAYVYGAMGDNAFDCSGLTMRARGAAGVGLPHSSSAQYGSGPHISASALQPGDPVFYYSPISHVGMYIGNGLIVHAANPWDRCGRVRPLLHALRRRGSPRLNARPRRPVAHVGGWPVFRCVWGWLRSDCGSSVMSPIAPT
ncbi:C40 family peptidase [Nocardioides sp. B-3]|uniref:C40 family peptidase n=1 Tax=Nocardioides sp. B-3 TaxID=2895565 RepID=UPI002152BEA5|nr:NlpC/P60 family protein [Nocardioides sp. B-3]UUZ59721.1 NlpC/P60 family protein [Nocardioides sp. B-3]